MLGGFVVVVVGMGVSVGAHAQRWRDDTATTIGDTAEWTNKVELADVDGDGWLDVILANGAGYASPGPAEASRVFRNIADWTGAAPFFEEITGEVFGTATAHTSRSCQLTMPRTTTDANSSRLFDTNISRPIWTSSCSESMSDVIRDTTTPAFSRS